MWQLNQTVSKIPMPARIAKLPVSEQGYPIPWFVPWRDGQPLPELADPVKRMKAISGRRCWVCGEPLGTYLAFILGSMCLVNRITAEPAMHKECAEYTVKVCPFLTKPKMKRNSSDNKRQGDKAPGIMIERNPGVCAVYVTRAFKTINDGAGGRVIQVGLCISVDYYREGRPATRAEVIESMQSGLPLLKQHAYTRAALEALDTQFRDALTLLPAE